MYFFLFIQFYDFILMDIYLFIYSFVFLLIDFNEFLCISLYFCSLNVQIDIQGNSKNIY